MFERFTEKAIKVMMLAQEEARRLGHNFVGTEQILLGLIGEGTGIAAKVLKFMGVNLKDARIEVEKIIGRGSGFVAIEIPFTPRAKRLLKLSLEEAHQLGHNYIGTEHLLLGLIREGEGVAARVLEILDVDLAKTQIMLRNMVIPQVSSGEGTTDKELNTKKDGKGSPIRMRRVDQTSTVETNSANQERNIEKEQQTDQKRNHEYSYKHIERIDLSTAVCISYTKEIESVVSVLRSGLSALVKCDKMVVEHLWREIVRISKLNPIILEISDVSTIKTDFLQGQLRLLKEKIQSLQATDVLVVPHLDLVAGGSYMTLTDAAREFTELVYRASERSILAFTDISLDIPEVLAARFSTRSLIQGVPRSVKLPDGSEVLLGQALVTVDEANRFIGFEPDGLYKNVSGMNPIQIRHAIAFAIQEHEADSQIPVEKLYQAIRTFKAKSSANFEVPDVSFEDIGGYESVKELLLQAINIIGGSYNFPNERLKQELVPRGFIFHGPPGTGKTLFAKAIANKLNATILVVSGPEVIDMYVGESERKIRELFIEARRNAPSVIVFDEFDSIAAKRSSNSDGASRAGNSVVAQLLTEMDGFRPEATILVIGTTNRLDIIDEALLRPSRFQEISIELPDYNARRKIAEIHAQHFEVEITPDLLDTVANFTTGFNGDEIRSIFRDACVGQFCSNPPIKVTAKRLGNLVGRLRLAKKKHNASSSTMPSVRVGGVSRMISLTNANNRGI